MDNNQQNAEKIEQKKITPYGDKYGLKVPNKHVLKMFTVFRDLIYRGKFNEVTFPVTLHKSNLYEKLTGKNCETYSLGYEDDACIEDLLMKSNLNVLYEDFLEELRKEEINGLLDMTITEIYSDNTYQIFGYLICSNKYDLLLGCGFQVIDNEKSKVQCNTYIFIRRDGIITEGGSFDLESYQRDLISTNITLHEYVRRITLNLDRDEKYQILSSFIDSEWRTNQYDRMFLGLLSLNPATLDRIKFIANESDIKHTRVYIKYARKMVRGHKDCAFLVRSDSISNEEIDNMPRLDALKYVLENYMDIPLIIPQPKNLKTFLESKKVKIEKKKKEESKNDSGCDSRPNN